MLKGTFYVVAGRRGITAHLGQRGPNGEWPDQALCGFEMWQNIGDSQSVRTGRDVPLCQRCLATVVRGRP